MDGEHGHDATFRAAAALVNGFALGEEAAFALLSAEYNPRCSPPWPADKLAHKIHSALGATSTKPRGYLLGQPSASGAAVEWLQSYKIIGGAPKWPPLDADRRAQIVAAGPGAADLCDLSPVRFDSSDGSEAGEIVERLFATPAAPDPLLCIGQTNSKFATRPLSTWINADKLPGAALIVPSPMSARTGRTKEGRISEHTLGNTGPRRFLIVEFDQGVTDEHAALLWHLADVGPLTLVVHSGGKSLHAWFYCHGQSEESLRGFMCYAVSIGADKATWTRSQFVRLPAGRRENGARQNVFFFDPTAIR